MTPGTTPAALQDTLNAIAAEIAAAPERGRPAQYIPELAEVDPGQFGIAVSLGDRMLVAGAAETPFSVQSISKVFTLTLAMARLGDGMLERVGCEPSGNAFNSIVQLEAERGRPRNPFINAGALVLADMVLAGRTPAAALAEITDFVAAASGGPVAIDRAVALSEARTAHRNRSLAHFMAAEGNLTHAVEDVLTLYTQHCALAMDCRQLAAAGRYLAFGGVVEGHRLAPARRVRRITALMLTCGHYDGSGEFAYRVGLPGKSGVGGGILAVVPGVASVAAWCPGLGPKGNSLLATQALERLADATGWSVFRGAEGA